MRAILLQAAMILSVAWGALPGSAVADAGTSGLRSIDTKHTVSKVRTALKDGASYIVASTYEGTLLGVGYDGAALWHHKLSGYMNHDLWCEDITGDGKDEVLAANADGAVYCLDSDGDLRWTWRANEAPMNAVCVVHQGTHALVVCGGYDKSIYYLSSDGRMLKEIPSSTYSVEKSWGFGKNSKPIPPGGLHTANFLRPVRRADGTCVLAVHGVLHANSGRGSIYLFKPLEAKPFKTIKIRKAGSVGELRTCDVDRDGTEEILTGTSGAMDDAGFSLMDISTGEQAAFELSPLRRKIDGFGYRVVQPEMVSDGGRDCFLVLFGSRILLVPPGLNSRDVEVLTCRYAFNDMWKDPVRNTIILAGSQSGGSCIHILDPGNPGWKGAYQDLAPPGKVAAIRAETDAVRRQLQRFTPPAWERTPVPVYLMSEPITDSVADLVRDLRTNYRSPVFLHNIFLREVEDWDRSSMANDVYRKKRDQRKKYTLTRDQVLDVILPEYQTHPGISYWGGHGTDPYQISLKTQRAILDGADGKKTVIIFPELEEYDQDFAWVMKDHVYPLAEYCRGKNANLYIRGKHTLWQAIAYLPLWSRMLSGEFADVFVPSMEETTDKSMELSVAARMGIWASGAVNNWGARCARDNTSYDRTRQHSHQMLPNHFLRQMVYNISSGATYINNFAVDQDYMSLLWELIARGALYVPKRSEIVSFSPVHLSMTGPDKHYLNEGNNVKWTTFYDRDVEKKNPLVFSRLNGTWPGAPVTEWDFSRYAAGVKERRLNFLPPYEHGLVLITPPQIGVFAADRPPRGMMTDHLHPLYATILKEYITDGRHYYSPDGAEQYAADEYYRTLEADIKDRAGLLPLTVSGGVAWVAAQTSPTHVRLTLVDSGYINPKARTAEVRFHRVVPVAMVDLLDETVFDITDPSSIKVPVPCGMFRFIDIELKRAFFASEKDTATGPQGEGR